MYCRVVAVMVLVKLEEEILCVDSSFLDGVYLFDKKSLSMSYCFGCYVIIKLMKKGVLCMIINVETIKFLKNAPNLAYQSVKTEFLYHSNKLEGFTREN